MTTWPATVRTTVHKTAKCILLSVGAQTDLIHPCHGEQPIAMSFNSHNGQIDSFSVVMSRFHYRETYLQAMKQCCCQTRDSDELWAQRRCDLFVTDQCLLAAQVPGRLAPASTLGPTTVPWWATDSTQLSLAKPPMASPEHRPLQRVGVVVRVLDRSPVSLLKETPTPVPTRFIWT